MLIVEVDSEMERLLPERTRSLEAANEALRQRPAKPSGRALRGGAPLERRNAIDQYAMARLSSATLSHTSPRHLRMTPN